MDPLLDEKFILSISQIFPEFFSSVLGVRAVREAFGPSKNEGLCYETCTMVEFEGDVNGQLYLSMDGYTKLKLLPKIARSFHIDPTTRSHAPSIILEFANQVCAELIGEMKLGRFSIDIKPPENLNHKLVAFDLEKNREYILIYFLKDEEAKAYLGRIYLTLLLQKY